MAPSVDSLSCTIHNWFMCGCTYFSIYSAVGEFGTIDVCMFTRGQHWRGQLLVLWGGVFMNGEWPS